MDAIKKMGVYASRHLKVYERNYSTHDFGVSSYSIYSKRFVDIIDMDFSFMCSVTTRG